MSCEVLVGGVVITDCSIREAGIINLIIINEFHDLYLQVI